MLKKSIWPYPFMLIFKPGYAWVNSGGEISNLHHIIVAIVKLNSFFSAVLSEVLAALYPRDYEVGLRRSHIWNVCEGIACQVERCLLLMGVLLLLMHLNVGATRIMISLQADITLLQQSLIVIESGMGVWVGQLCGHSGQTDRLNSRLLNEYVAVSEIRVVLLMIVY